MREYPFGERLRLDKKFDGDKGTGNGLYTEEAVQESKRIMRSRNFHVKTDGSIAHSLATDTVEYLFGSMTGAPRVTQADIEKFTKIYGTLVNVPKVIATEEIKEDLTRPSKSTEAQREVNVVKDVDPSKLDHTIVQELLKHDRLIDDLNKWLILPDRALLSSLSDLAVLGRKLYKYPKHLNVYRGFDNHTGQESLGVKKMEVGSKHRFQSDTAVISTSLDPSVSRAFGATLAKIELVDSDNFLIITDEMYHACAIKSNQKKTSSQYEVILMPKIDVQVEVVEVTPSFLKRVFGETSVLARLMGGLKGLIKSILPKSFSSESLIETSQGTQTPAFVLDGKSYSREAILRESIEVKAKMVKLDKLSWMLDVVKPDPALVDDADLNAPLIVTPYKGGVYVVIHGLPRVQRAYNEGVPVLPVKVIKTAILEKTLIAA